MKYVEAKTVVLGSQGVGKTSVVRRCVEDVFENDVGSTIGAAFSAHKININGYQVQLQIWDTAGQERFKSMAPMFYRKASVAVLVYDITDQESFDALKGWVRELILNVDKSIAMIMFGNKCDLEQKRQVTLEMAEEYAKEIGAEHVQMSALSNKGVAEGFERVAAVMLSTLGESHAQVYDDAQRALPQFKRTRSVTVTEPDSPREDLEHRRCAC